MHLVGHGMLGRNQPAKGLILRLLRTYPATRALISLPSSVRHYLLSRYFDLYAQDEFAAVDSVEFVAAIKRAAEALVAAEPEITRQDTIAGDGDAGLTLKSGAEGSSRSFHLATQSTDIRGTFISLLVVRCSEGNK